MKNWEISQWESSDLEITLKHVSCFRQVKETRAEWNFGRTRSAVETRTDRRVFPHEALSSSLILSSSHECFYNSVETRRTIFSISFRKIRGDERKLL